VPSGRCSRFEDDGLAALCVWQFFHHVGFESSDHEARSESLLQFSEMSGVPVDTHTLRSPCCSLWSPQ